MKEQINDYLHYLNIERGLSANTRQSYERDLEQYLHFLEEHDKSISFFSWACPLQTIEVRRRAAM